MKYFFSCLLTVLLVLGFASIKYAPTAIYVDADAAGAADGSSWADAYPHLQDALAAATQGDEVWVAAGTYHPDRGAAQTRGDRPATFRLKNGVTLLGGFAGGESDRYTRNPRDHAAILSGDLGTEGDRTDNSYHVVTGSGTDSTAVLDGFTITEGNADGTNLDRAGGGMIVDQGNPLVINVRFLGNAAKRGGGLFNRNARPTLVNTVFSGNTAEQGGGLYNEGSDPALRNVTLSANTADEGAGIYNENSSPRIANSILWGAPSDTSSARDMTFAKRKEALDAIEAEVASIEDGTMEDLEALASTIKERAAFEAAGVSDDSTVWGRFTDGRLLVVVGNRQPPADTPDENRQPSVLRDVDRRAQQTARRVPGQTSAYALNALGSCFQPQTALVSTLFEGAGYGVEFNDATVDVLKNVNNAGVFYLDAHGAKATTRDSARTFAFSTYTQVDSTRDAKYESDLDSGRLAYMIVDHQRGGGKCQEEKLYGITPLFVRKYFSFADDGLAFLNTCTSDNSIMRRAFANAGASTYAGWIKPVADADAGVAAGFFFDRALGRNEAHRWIGTIQAETPPQRPFDYASVLKNMQKKAYDISHHNGEISQFRIKDLGDADGILVPTIERVIDFDNIYTIEGAFGEDPGEDSRQVTLDGDPLDVSHWSSSTIQIDKKDLPSPGGGGDVVVEVRGIESNKVPLTVWRNWNFSQTQHTGELRRFPDEQLVKEIDCRVNVRADVHDYREEPGTDPKEPTLGNIEVGPNSECVYDAHGAVSYLDKRDPDDPDDDVNVDIEWSGGGTVRGDSAISGSIDMKEEWIDMNINIANAPVGTGIVTKNFVDPDVATKVETTDVKWIDYEFGYYLNDDINPGRFDLDEYDVQAGRQEIKYRFTHQPDGPYAIYEAGAVEAENSPKPDMRR